MAWLTAALALLASQHVGAMRRMPLQEQGAAGPRGSDASHSGRILAAFWLRCAHTGPGGASARRPGPRCRRNHSAHRSRCASRACTIVLRMTLRSVARRTLLHDPPAPLLGVNARVCDAEVPAAGAVRECAQYFGRCGGPRHTGATCCLAGATCVRGDDNSMESAAVSRCLPEDDDLRITGAQRAQPLYHSGAPPCPARAAGALQQRANAGMQRSGRVRDLRGACNAPLNRGAVAAPCRARRAS